MIYLRMYDILKNCCCCCCFIFSHGIEETTQDNHDEIRPETNDPIVKIYPTFQDLQK